MQHHIYKDLVHTPVREILVRSFIMFFKKFEYRQDPLMKLYGTQFPRHHEQMLLDCILIMEKECEHYITSTKRYGSDVQQLKKTLSTITTGKLVNLIVDCTDTIRSKKNWNSHGATLGLAISQLSSIISSLGKASEDEVRPDFNELIPCDVIHTGYKYRNTHSVCTEYMVSTCESQIIIGGDEIYLNAERFNQHNHAGIVNKLFSEEIDGFPAIPEPRPTQTHTYDFGCIFMGA